MIFRVLQDFIVTYYSLNYVTWGIFLNPWEIYIDRIIKYFEHCFLILTFQDRFENMHICILNLFCFLMYLVTCGGVQYQYLIPFPVMQICCSFFCLVLWFRIRSSQKKMLVLY